MMLRRHQSSRMQPQWQHAAVCPYISQAASATSWPEDASAKQSPTQLLVPFDKVLLGCATGLMHCGQRMQTSLVSLVPTKTGITYSSDRANVVQTSSQFHSQAPRSRDPPHVQLYSKDHSTRFKASRCLTSSHVSRRFTRDFSFVAATAVSFSLILGFTFESPRGRVYGLAAELAPTRSRPTSGCLHQSVDVSHAK